MTFKPFLTENLDLSSFWDLFLKLNDLLNDLLMNLMIRPNESFSHMTDLVLELTGREDFQTILSFRSIL